MTGWASSAAVRLAVGLATAVSMVLVAEVATAAFTGSASASATIDTAVLAPPTSPSAQDGCTTLVSLAVWIDLSWTATASTWADGYRIARSTTSGGPYTVIANVAGQSTTTYRDSGLSLSTTYYYVIRSTKHSWTSVPTAQVSDRTKGLLCL